MEPSRSKDRDKRARRTPDPYDEPEPEPGPTPGSSEEESLSQPGPSKINRFKDTAKRGLKRMFSPSKRDSQSLENVFDTPSAAQSTSTLLHRPRAPTPTPNLRATKTRETLTSTSTTSLPRSVASSTGLSTGLARLTTGAGVPSAKSIASDIHATTVAMEQHFNYFKLHKFSNEEDQDRVNDFIQRQTEGLNKIRRHLDALHLRAGIDNERLEALDYPPVPVGDAPILQPSSFARRVSTDGDLGFALSTTTGAVTPTVFPDTPDIDPAKFISISINRNPNLKRVPVEGYILSFFLEALKVIPEEHLMFGKIEKGKLRAPRTGKHANDPSWTSKLTRLASNIANHHETKLGLTDMRPGDCWMYNDEYFAFTKSKGGGKDASDRTMTVKIVRLCAFLARPTRPNFIRLIDKVNAPQYPFCHFCHNGAGSQRNEKKDSKCVNGFEHGHFQTKNFNSAQIGCRGGSYQLCPGHNTLEGDTKKCIYVHRGLGAFKECLNLDATPANCLCQTELKCF